MGLSTHILDTASGRPAAGVAVSLSQRSGERWDRIGHGITDADGRCRMLLGSLALDSVEYRLQFETGAYFAAQGLPTFFPMVEIVFKVSDPAQHYHVPLLVAPHGYTTYRGS
jgi:5-hydroxyisourate hydrolase